MSKTNREQFEAWGMSDTDLRITLECETYAGIAWLAWQAATNEAEAQLTALTSQLESVVAENAALKAVESNLVRNIINDLGDTEFQYEKVQTPATSAFLAEVRAQGVEMLTEKLQQLIGEGNFEGNEVGLIAGAVYTGADIAAQLRQGGAV